MASKRDKETQKENGHVVMEALRNVDQVPTLLNLARYIATTYKSNENKVKDPLKRVLDSAINLGLITREKGKYYVYGEEEEESEDDTEVTEPTDRRRRRRRSRSNMQSRKRKSRSGSKSRSRSRRRRRRRSSSSK